jgi:hypothetical protein
MANVSFPLGRFPTFVLGLALGIGSTYAIAHWVVAHDYSYSEMDWDQDGVTTLEEMLHAGDVGLQIREVSGRPCRYFFEYKDGRPIKTLCDGKAVARDPTLPSWAQ